jgi:hypothetical protein
LRQKNSDQFSLSNFTASLAGSSIYVEWSSRNEMGISSYDIERSTDSVNFIFAGPLPSLGTAGPNNYQFYDSLSSGSLLYYRLKIYDSSGQYFYSQIIKVSSTSILVYPNPATNSIFVQYPYSISASGITIFDVSGRAVKSIQMNPGTTQIQISLTGILQGVYYVKWSDYKSSFTKSLLIR